MRNVFSPKSEFNKPIFWYEEKGRWMMQNGSSSILAMWQLNGYDDLLLKSLELCTTFRHTNLHFFITFLLRTRKMVPYIFLSSISIKLYHFLHPATVYVLMSLFWWFNEAAFNRKEALKCNCFENLHLVLLTLKS